MTDKELKERFLSIPKGEINPLRKESSICQVMKQGTNIRGLTRITYWDRIRTMAGYLSPWVWLAQAMVILMGSFLFWNVPQYDFSGICSVLAPLIGCIGCVEIQRTYYCGMWEMEKACRYDLRHVMLLKMQITGGVDLTIVLCLMGLSAGGGIELQKSILTILIPYLLSTFVYFMLLCRTRGRLGGYLLIGAGILMAMCNSVLLDGTSKVVWEILSGHSEWIIILAILAVDLMLWSMRRFFIYCDREENQKWNFG